MRSRLNDELLESEKWVLQWSLNQLNDAAGFARGYIYRLASGENTSLESVDKIYDAMVTRYQELGLPVPGNLWNRLIKHEGDDQLDF